MCVVGGGGEFRLVLFCSGWTLVGSTIGGLGIESEQMKSESSGKSDRNREIRF